MSVSTIPVATIPLSTAAAAPATPVTPEEAAAIARRIRVESRLPRVALVGTILGLVVGVAAVWPFLDSDGYMANVLVSGEFGALAFIPGWLLAGLLPLLAFYAGRLHFQTGHSSTGELEASLRKIRRIILWSMFASVLALVFLLGQSRARLGRGDHTPWLSLLYVASFAGCAAIIGDVRRGLGDFDSEHQRRRRKLARGFMVELNPTGPATTTAAMSSPMPSLPLKPVPDVVPADDGDDDDIPLATPAPRPGAAGMPPPMPITAIPVAAAMALPAEPIGIDEDAEHFKDLRLLLTLAAVVAVMLFALRVGENLASLAYGIEYVFTAVNATFSGPGPRGQVGGIDALFALAILVAMIGVVLLIPCGAMWILWGLLALNYGPAFRRTMFWVAVVTVAAALIATVPAWLYPSPTAELSMSSRRMMSMPRDRLARAPEIIHGLLLVLLLTRPGVKRLLAPRGASDDEG